MAAKHRTGGVWVLVRVSVHVEVFWGWIRGGGARVAGFPAGAAVPGLSVHLGPPPPAVAGNGRVDARYSPRKDGHVTY